MKIGIIGSGNIGGNLGKHWAKVGHEVMFSSRHPKELKQMADEVGAKVGTIEEAAAFGEVILLAIPSHPRLFFDLDHIGADKMTKQVRFLEYGKPEVLKIQEVDGASHFIMLDRPDECKSNNS